MIEMENDGIEGLEVHAIESLVLFVALWLPLPESLNFSRDEAMQINADALS